MNAAARPLAVSILTLLALIRPAPALSQDGSSEAAPVESGEGMTPEQFEATLSYSAGRIDIENGLATLQVPETFRFLGAEDAQSVLVDAWGNPPDSAEGVLGMLVPAGLSPISDDGWAVVVTYDEDGYVDDKDAEKIDYDDLLADMKKAADQESEERVKQGFGTLSIVGWAEPPTYDASTHKMYWAKELAFGGEPENTLNYNVRVLGRKGVLNLNAVAGMAQLAPIRESMTQVLGFVEFNEGNRYADYVHGQDKVAAYGIAGLVAGAVAAKAGLFKVLLMGLLAAKKLVLAALVGLGVLVKKIFSGRGTPAATRP